VISQAIFWQVIVAIIIGLVAGIVSSRMYKITWNKHEAEVIGKIDLYGIVVLVLFIVFELNRTHVAELFASASSIGSIGFVLITAALFGRILGTSKKILQVLEQEKII
jgi:predicted histidine transporter YuiF (NhaC family)